jgi:hypothetical protein
MILNRSHIPWFLFTVVATLAIVAGYNARFHPEIFPHLGLPSWLHDPGLPRNTVGGTRIGLIYGTMAFLIFLFAIALGLRKKKPTWRMGKVKTWVRAHIWLTTLTIPLVGFHCGWSWGSPQTTWLLVLYIVVMASGYHGLAMQQFMPGLIKERLPREVVYDQIPNIRRHNLEGAKKLRAACATVEKGLVPAGSGPETGFTEDTKSRERIIAFLDTEALPYLSAHNGKGYKLSNARESETIFRVLKINVSSKWRPRVEELQEWCEERRRIDIQVTLQHWLHGWLLVHAPISFLLAVFTLWHAIVAVRLFIVQP